MKVVFFNDDYSFEQMRNLLNVFGQAVFNNIHCQAENCRTCTEEAKCANLNAPYNLLKSTLYSGYPCHIAFDTDYYTDTQLLDIKNIFLKARQDISCSQFHYCHDCKIDKQCMNIDDVCQKLIREVRRRNQNDNS